MFEIKGARNTAICYADIVEDEAISQIMRMCNYDFTDDSKIRIMPDVHAGKGCTIGTTMTIKDKAVPNIVGVDIGCGVFVIDIGKEDLDLSEVDKICHEIPHGRDVWESKQEKFHLPDLKCYRDLKDSKRLEKSLGTLGGGNHFIEVDIGDDGTKYLVIHTGSRNLGKQVAELYQRLAVDLSKGKEDYLKKRDALIQDYKERGIKNQLQKALKELSWEKKEATIPEDLAYVYGEYLDNYLHDMHLCQQFAKRNREVIGEIILDRLSRKANDSWCSIHNYISVDEKMIRKGAISAHKDEKVIIPINMRDGSIIGIGKGNPDWNYSAPHGAGRLMSRTKAKQELSLAEYKDAMSDIYTTCVNRETIDEAPMAYKPLKDIVDTVQDTVEIIDIIKPIYNFKSSD